MLPAAPSGAGVGDEEFLTVREVAARLKVSRATVYAWVDSGALPHSRLGSIIRLRRSDVEAFAARRAGEGSR